MFLSLKGSVGRNPMINRVGQKLLQLFGGASAAYSLRNLASNIASVVRVRRGSDNSERDFSAEDVSSGAMTQWVNAQVVPPLDLKALDSDGERTGSVIAAEAAYSLRNLSDSYTGNVVDVRRSSDDAEESFTAAEVADGTLTDWVVGDVADLIDDAQYFNGTNAQVTIPDSADFTVSTSIDVSADVLLTSNAASGIINKGIGTSGSREWSLLITSSNELQFVVFDESLSTNVSATTSDFPVNEIFTVRGYYDGSDIYIYVNGVEKATAAGVIAIENLSADIQLGNSLAASRHLQGIVSNVSISVNGNEVAHYKGTGATPWDDTIGSNDGTPSNLVTFTGQGYNGFVSKWYDQSGNDNHATQTTAASQPKIVDGGTLVSGGPLFDGSDDFLSGPDLSLGTGSRSIFLVTQPISIDTNSILNLRNSSTTGSAYALTSEVATRCLGRTWVSSTPASTSSKNLMSNVYTSGNLHTGNSMYLDGEAVTRTSGTDGVLTDASGALFLGATSATSGEYEGTIQEIIIYKSDQSDNRTAFESNIGDYYGINLPSGVDTENNEVDGFVETWYDQSGNGNDATQQVSGSQPKIVDAGILVSGGLLFDGSDDFFDAPVPLDGATVHTSIVVATPTQASRILSIKEDGRADENWRMFVSGSNDASYGLDNGAAFASSRAITLGNPSLLIGTYDANTLKMFVNGETPTTTASVSGFTLNTTGDLEIGRNANSGGNDYGGKIEEIIIYNTDQSANRPAIEANINNQYDIY